MVRSTACTARLLLMVPVGVGMVPRDAMPTTCCSKQKVQSQRSHGKTNVLNSAATDCVRSSEERLLQVQG